MSELRTELLTADEAISSTMTQYLFINHMTRADIGEILELPGQSISGRMRGRTKWAASEIAILAAHFGVTPNDLMPTPDRHGGWLPAPYVRGYAKVPAPQGTGTSDLVAGTGFEPATSGL